MVAIRPLHTHFRPSSLQFATLAQIREGFARTSPAHRSVGSAVRLAQESQITDPLALFVDAGIGKCVVHLQHFERKAGRRSGRIGQYVRFTASTHLQHALFDVARQAGLVTKRERRPHLNARRTDVQRRANL